MPTIVTGLDIETTGLKHSDGDRIIEVSLQSYRLEDQVKVLNFTQRINPDGRKINPKAQEVHKIQASDLIGKPLFKDVAPKIALILQKSAAVVTHNGEGFDLPFLAFEMATAGMSLPGHLASFDTMVEGMFATYNSKPPSLKELCWCMGVEYDADQAHAADYDVDVMMVCFFKAAERGLFDISTLSQKQAAA